MEILQDVRPGIPWHPCMNEYAHSQVARLHLPVAPVCNSRCIYCRRGISSEPGNGIQRGPGQTETILTPQQAVEKTASYLEDWGDNSIVGIAGPGDPLANESTLETLRLLHHYFPKIRLCLCTNGLCLPDHIAFLKEIGLPHLTVTVNGVQPEIVEQIQPWIRYHSREYNGREAAELLISNQLQGIEEAVAGNIFIKVNCVVLPEINGNHVLDVVREVKRRGAGIINLIPRLNKKKDAFYCSSAANILPQLQHQAEAILPVFTKCKQCRADAEGIPEKREQHVG